MYGQFDRWIDGKYFNSSGTGVKLSALSSASSTFSSTSGSYFTTGPGKTSTLPADLSAISSASRAHTDSRATRLQLFRRIYQQFRPLLELTQTLERPDFNSSTRYRRFLFCSRWLRPHRIIQPCAMSHVPIPARYEPALVLRVKPVAPR